MISKDQLLEWKTIGTVIVLLLIALVFSMAYAGSNGEIAAGPTCMSTIQYIDQMLHQGMTREQIMEDFEQWQSMHAEPAPNYSNAMRGVIAAAGGPGWPEQAYHDCVATLQGSRI